MLSKIANKHLLTRICLYLEPKDIISFLESNKSIKSKLNPSENSITNKIFYYGVARSIFNLDEDNDETTNYAYNEKELLENHWNSKINWKTFFCQIYHQFKNYPNKEISQKVLNYFKTHIYLLDLRKENSTLEYKYSSTHQTICYDKNFNEKFIYNHYNKYINKNYLTCQNGRSSEIEILQKRISFEDELFNFKNIYDEFASNNEYKNILKMIISYDFENLNLIYEEMKKNSNKKNISNIIYFILWSSYCFLLYTIYIYETIIRFENEKDETEFLNQFTKNYSDYINTALTMNSNFQNVNIIINFLNKYLIENNQESKKNKKNKVKFSLYDLYLKIYQKQIFEKLAKKVNSKTSFLLRKILEEFMENKKEKNKENYMDIDDTLRTADNTPYNSEDEMENLSEMEDNDFSFDLETPKNELLSNVTNSVLDMEINKDNSLGINHTCIKLGGEYNQYEEMIINEIMNFIKINIEKGKEISEIFEVIKKSLQCNRRNKIFSLNSNNLELINKTKKLLLENSYKMLVPNIVKNLENDFSSHLKYDQSTQKRILCMDKIEFKNFKDYDYDLSEFSEKKRIKIEEKVEEEMRNIKSCLYEQNINGFDVNETIELVNKYMNNNDIDLILLVKKMIYFYYEELEAFEENDKQIENILTKNRKLNSKLTLQIN